MVNEDVRVMVFQSGIQYKDIAKKMGITNLWLCQLMKKPLSLYNRARIIDALAQLQNDQEEVADESDHIPVDSVINLIKFAGYDVNINKKGDITIRDGEEIVCDPIKTKKIINLIMDYVNFVIEHQRCI